MRILVLARYGALGASTRVRMLLYRQALERAGYQLSVSSLLDDSYVRSLYEGKGAYGRVAAGYVRRLTALLSSRTYDLIWLEKEALPWFPAFLETALLPRSVPLVIDYDDATFHGYDQHPNAMVRAVLGRRIDRLMERADWIVTGNEYLAARAKNSGARRVDIIPTVVDLERYEVSDPKNAIPCVGWIGSPATQHLLAGIATPLATAARDNGLSFCAIGARDLPFKGNWCRTQSWSEDTETKAIANIDIGVMPLRDTPWERGKCGYKLIQYMAAGKPVIASPVGVNKYIVRHGENGYLADSDGEWEWALGNLAENPLLRERMGRAGRRRVEEEFCLSVTAPTLVHLFRQLVGG